MMYVKQVRRKCMVRGCRETATFSISRTRENGNTPIICEKCLKEALEAVENYQPEEKKKAAAPPPLFFREAAPEANVGTRAEGLGTREAADLPISPGIGFVSNAEPGNSAAFANIAIRDQGVETREDRAPEKSRLEPRFFGKEETVGRKGEVLDAGKASNSPTGDEAATKAKAAQGSRKTAGPAPALSGKEEPERRRAKQGTKTRAGKSRTGGGEVK